MQTHEVRKSVTDPGDIVNISILQNLRLHGWQLENKRVLEHKIKEYGKFKKQVMELLPEFDLLVMAYEFRWNKHRSRFTVAEKEIVRKEFVELKNLK